MARSMRTNGALQNLPRVPLEDRPFGFWRLLCGLQKARVNAFPSKGLCHQAFVGRNFLKESVASQTNSNTEGGNKRGENRKKQDDPTPSRIRRKLRQASSREHLRQEAAWAWRSGGRSGQGLPGGNACIHLGPPARCPLAIVFLGEGSLLK